MRRSIDLTPLAHDASISQCRERLNDLCEQVTGVARAVISMSDNADGATISFSDDVTSPALGRFTRRLEAQGAEPLEKFPNSIRFENQQALVDGLNRLSVLAASPALRVVPNSGQSR